MGYIVGVAQALRLNTTIVTPELEILRLRCKTLGLYGCCC